MVLPLLKRLIKTTIMKSLEYLNQIPPVILDNFNRDSSACFSRSGCVIHSGIHRSTAFVSREDAVESLRWAKGLGQRALNGWVEGTIEGLELTACEHLALARQFPAWVFYYFTGKQGTFFTASQSAGKFETRVSAGSWRELAGKVGA